MIEAVISDFGGVLTSPLMEAFDRVEDHIEVPPDAYPKAFAHSLAHDGVHPLFALERGEITYEDFVRRLERGLAEAAGITVSLHDFHDRLMTALEPNDELFDHYRTLRRTHGVRFALCTNNVREWEPLWRAKLPIDEIFETVVDSGFVGLRKPDPAIYALVLERLALPAAECVFVDDLEVNVEAARVLGFAVVHHEDTARTIARLDKLIGSVL
jgi:putative hydrolase of the HAD superfamily